MATVVSIINTPEYLGFPNLIIFQGSGPGSMAKVFIGISYLSTLAGLKVMGS